MAHLILGFRVWGWDVLIRNPENPNLHKNERFALGSQAPNPKPQTPNIPYLGFQEWWLIWILGFRVWGWDVLTRNPEKSQLT